jgi:hypothetical protein
VECLVRKPVSSYLGLRRRSVPPGNASVPPHQKESAASRATPPSLSHLLPTDGMSRSQAFAATSCVARPKAPSHADYLRGVGKMRTLVGASEEILKMSAFVWAGTNSQFDEPFFDIGADDIRMILLQVVNARAKLHHSAVLKPLRKALSKSRRSLVRIKSSSPHNEPRPSASLRRINAGAPSAPVDQLCKPEHCIPLSEARLIVTHTSDIAC